MSDASPITLLHCTQCGGELHPDEGQIFLTCPYCKSTVYVDKAQVVFHWYLAPTLDESKARSSLARWMAGNQTVKDLDKKSTLVSTTFEYFPLWYFKRKHPNSKEEIILTPASATSVSELRTMNIPAGDLRKYDSSLDSQAHPPSVPLESTLAWLAERQVPAYQLIENALVHLPIFTFKYNYKNRTYTALVEAGTGGVYANIYPAKAESPYLVVGGLTMIIYLCLALAPIIGSFIGGDGSLIGLLICFGAGILVAPLLFILARWVAAKI